MGDDSTFGKTCIPKPLLWEQWWSVDQLVPLGLSEDRSSTTNCVYTQTGLLLDGFVYRYNTDSTDHWNDISPVTDYTHSWSGLNPTTDYTAPSSVSERVVSKESLPFQGYWHPPLSPKNPNRKQHRDSDDIPTRKNARRTLLGDGNINPQTEKKVEHSIARRKRNATGNGARSAQQSNDHAKMVQERNRIAANKFRVKQREDLLRLESREQDLERIHHGLSNCVADLTLEVYELKMQMLQHSGCNCALIQNYLVHESQRYVQALEEKSQREAWFRQRGSLCARARTRRDENRARQR